ncbi:MAG: Fe-S cluster assembly protein SufD [Parvibaculaceae bacterium]
MSDLAKTYLDALAAPVGGPAWLDMRRRSARASVADAGFPTRRVEAWKYTDLERLLSKTDWQPAAPHEGAVIVPDGHGNPFAAIPSWKLVFVNGFFRPDLSELDDLPAGLEIRSLETALGSGTKFEAAFDANGPEALAPVTALNAACARDGAVIRLAEGVTLDKPVQLIHYAVGSGTAAAHTRNIVDLGAGASMTLLEAQIGWGGTYLADRVTNIRLGDKASMTHVRVEDEDEAAIHLSTVLGDIAAGGAYRATTLALGGRAGRMQSAFRFTGEGAHAESNAAYLMRNDQHIDTTVVVDHAVPECTSGALAKGVLDGRATGVFQGKVIVAPHAQKSDARQMTNALLLSRDAAMNAKPELEIYADDVQCAHGSTVGEIDENALFYLRSRGIEEETARRMLITAFLGDVLVQIPHEEARDALIGRADTWFEKAQVTGAEA